MADVIMPQMGESIFEGTITKWLKKPGDKVERDEPLFEISTDKVDAEIPAPTAGILREIKIGEGKTVPIQTVVAVIEAANVAAGAESAPPREAQPANPKAEPAPAAASVQNARTAAPPQGPAESEMRNAPGPDARPAAVAPSREPSATSAPQNSSGAAASVSGANVGRFESSGDDGERSHDAPHSSPLVRRLAREHNIDLTTLHGSGAGGRISKKDVLAAIEGSGAAQTETSEPPTQPSSQTQPAPGTETPSGSPIQSAVPRDRIYFGRYEVQPMSVMRQRIAEHMVLSKRVSPHVYSIDEADVSRIVHVRETSKAEFEARHQTKLTFMPFFVRACVAALREFPSVNASLDGTNIVLHGEINVGIAVALDWGLLVPVVKNAEEKNFLGLQRSINDLADRARKKKLKPEDVQESTFSITNPGTFGGLMGLPVINQPNVAILGIGAIQKRPVVIDDAIAIRSMVYLTLSYDHRVVDGAVAHQFMGEISDHLENWNEEIL